MTFVAACWRRRRPTDVEPVKESLRTRGSARAASTTGPGLPVGTTLTTPRGTPASCRIPATRSAVSGVSAAGLSTTVQPAASAPGDLAGRHGSGKVPGRDEEAHADWSLGGQDAGRSGRARAELAAEMRGLLAEPSEELGGVSDFAACVGLGLAHLQAHHGCEVLGARDHEVVGTSEDLRAVPRWGAAPCSQGVVRGVDCRDHVARGCRGDIGQNLAR